MTRTFLKNQFIQYLSTRNNTNSSLVYTYKNRGTDLKLSICFYFSTLLVVVTFHAGKISKKENITAQADVD